MSVSTPQIKAQLERVLDSDPTAQAVAIRATTEQVWPELVSAHGRSFLLRWCNVIGHPRYRARTRAARSFGPRYGIAHTFVNA